MKNKSFTLIELLVVIVIIGILAGVIIVSTSSSISKASIAKSKVFSESLRNELILNLKMEFSFDSIEGSSAPYTTNDDWGGKSIPLYYFSSVTPPYVIANDCSFSGTLKCPQLLDESECVKGNCLDFNYSNRPFIELAEEDRILFNDGDPWTISSWLKILTSYSVEYIGRRWTQNYLEIDNVGLFSFRNDLGTIYSAPNSFPKVRDYNWHLITWVANGDGSIFVYVDSELATTIAVDNNSFRFENVGQAYYYDQSISGHFFGHMDELQVYDSALGEGEIKEIYNANANSLFAKKLINILK